MSNLITIQNITSLLGTPSRVSISGDDKGNRYVIEIRGSLVVNYEDIEDDNLFVDNLITLVQRNYIKVLMYGVTLSVSDLSNLRSYVENLSNATLQDVNIYVNGSTGNDLTGTGTESNPYATLTKAYEAVPYRIKNSVHIRYSGGTYTSFPEVIHNYCERSGQLTFECTDAPTELSSEYTITGKTTVGTFAGFDLTVAGAGWSVDEWFGRFIMMTSGSSNGYIFPICSNTADTIKIAQGFVTISNGDKFKIVDPAAIISTTHAITFDVSGSISWLYSQFGIANTAFVTTEDQPFTWKGDSSAILCLCRFLVPTNENIWLQSGGSINGASLLDSNGFDTAYYSLGYFSALQLCNSLTASPSSPDTDVYIEPGAESNNSGTALNNFVTRTGMFVSSNKLNLGFCSIDHLVVDHKSSCQFAWGRFYIKSSYSTTDVVRVDDDSMFEGEDIHFDNSTRDFFNIEDFGKVIIENMSQNAAATRYAMYVGGLANAIITTGTVLTGTTADIYFVRSAATAAFPASGNNANDAEASWVIKK